MNIVGIKLWEILLIIAVLFLRSTAYETHFSAGRYVQVEDVAAGKDLLDTKTGKMWIWSNSAWEEARPAVP